MGGGSYDAVDTIDVQAPCWVASWQHDSAEDDTPAKDLETRRLYFKLVNDVWYRQAASGFIIRVCSVLWCLISARALWLCVPNIPLLLPNCRELKEPCELVRVTSLKR
jgi:hypothetical protein